MAKKNKKIIFFHIDDCEWCSWLEEEVWVWLKSDKGHESWNFVYEDDDSDVYSELENEVYFYPTIALVVDGIVVDKIVGVSSMDEYAHLLDTKMTKLH